MDLIMKDFIRKKERIGQIRRVRLYRKLIVFLNDLCAGMLFGGIVMVSVLLKIKGIL